MQTAQIETAGRLPENILHFARTLRSAGLAVGTGQVIDALVAVAAAGIEKRQDFYWSLRSVLVRRRSELPLFNTAFHLYFRNPRLLEKMMSLLLPTVHRKPDEKTSEAAVGRLLEAITPETNAGLKEGNAELQIDRSGTWSDRELLRARDFEQMTLAEQAEARRLLLTEIPLLFKRPTRRFRGAAQGGRYDLRATMRQMQRAHPDLIPLARKRPATREPDIVLICDISGSMSSYSRMFLLFAHLLTRRSRVVHSFVFGTNLTNISHHLRQRDADEALSAVSEAVSDWDGGTRITQCLRHFNQHWSRRVTTRNPVVILMSDGLERSGTHKEEGDLEFQTRRLRRSCRQLIWMNPMLRYRDFKPLASGIKIMLPHVDHFVPAHNLDSISAVIATLGDMRN